MTALDHPRVEPAPVETVMPEAASTLNSQRRMGSLLRTVLPPLAVAVAVGGLWYAYSGLVLTTNERIISLPYPHDVWRVAFVDGANRAELLNALWVTTKVSMTGLSISMLLGMSFAVMMSQARWIERSFYPYAVLLQTVPILALVPLIGLRFGFGLAAKVIVVVIISLFPIITNTLFGLKSPAAGLHDLFDLHGAGRWTRLVKLQLPASIPATFTGFQISAGLAVIGSIVGDFFFGRGEKGLGIRINNYTSRLKTEQLIGAIILSALLGIVVFWFFGWARSQLTRRWDETARE